MDSQRYHPAETFRLSRRLPREPGRWECPKCQSWNGLDTFVCEFCSWRRPVPGVAASAEPPPDRREL
jgi:hypothetical protein